MGGVSWKDAALLSGVLAFVIFFGARAASDLQRDAATIGKGVASFQELSNRFTTLAREKGGAYAFETLKSAPLPPNTDLHLLAHAVGDVLYEQKKIAGI